MKAFDYDLIVIGAGSGGVRAARVAASHGARVAIAEGYRVGGTCVICGCVPKKLYVLASRFRDELEDAEGFGWRLGEASFDWGALVSAKEEEISRLSRLYSQNLETAGVEIIPERATLTGRNGVRFSGGGRASARFILVATGAAPAFNPMIPGIELAISSNDIFDLPVFPKRLLVIGGGYIAMEFASVFARLGAEVHAAMRAKAPLRGFDEDLRRHLRQALVDAGVDVLTQTLPVRIEKTGNGLGVTLENGGSLEADVVLAATGRRPLTDNLGLEEAGVALRASGAIAVDEDQRTSAPSIYAIGDVTDRINLTPVAIREGQAFADSVFGGKPTRVDYELVPTAVFTTPEIGAVGLTEERAKERLGAVDIYETSFRPMRAALSKRAEKVFMKLIVDRESDRVMGAHVFGPEAAEMAQLLAIPLRMRARKQDFDAATALHPTLAEEIVTMRAPTRRHG